MDADTVLEEGATDAGMMVEEVIGVIATLELAVEDIIATAIVLLPSLIIYLMMNRVRMRLSKISKNW